MSDRAGGEAPGEIQLLCQVGLNAGASGLVTSDQNVIERLSRDRHGGAEIRHGTLVVELIVRIPQRVGDRQVRAELVLVPSGRDVIERRIDVARQTVVIAARHRRGCAIDERDTAIRNVVLMLVQVR